MTSNLDADKRIAELEKELQEAKSRIKYYEYHVRVLVNEINSRVTHSSYVHTPMPPGLEFSNAGTECDMLFGPCACGAWHSPEELPNRVKMFNQTKNSVD